MNGLNLNDEKNDILGELDSLNSLIGLAKSFVKEKKIRILLTDIQNDIFVIQAHIADPKNILPTPQNITFDRVFSLQKETFLIERRLKKIDHFIIPEGATAACVMHCIRVLARQIERKIPGYLKKPTLLAMYLDRVAGLMFAMARSTNTRAGVRERPPAYAQRNLRKKEGERYGRKRRKRN